MIRTVGVVTLSLAFLSCTQKTANNADANGMTLDVAAGDVGVGEVGVGEVGVGEVGVGEVGVGEVGVGEVGVGEVGVGEVGVGDAFVDAVLGADVSVPDVGVDPDGNAVTDTVAGPVCGNGICETGEGTTTCSKDCCSELYEQHEALCIQGGWQAISIEVGGLPRKALWKAPAMQWPKGAIIALHGGGGTHSNFCSNINLGQPMVDFSALALAEGFAIFSLDSTFNKVTDAQGSLFGKRWDSLAQTQRANIDLPFIEKVIVDTIPALRPAGSAAAIFITGISNGGFMATLAATHFDDKITAFAPVSSGDPYGAFLDMDNNPWRECAYGVFRDSETLMTVNDIGACVSTSYPSEKVWSTTNPAQKPPFKLFFHEQDGVLDKSCKEKVQQLLVSHGYPDNGSFALPGLLRSIWNHFWRQEYNAPLIAFFKDQIAP